MLQIDSKNVSDVFMILENFSKLSDPKCFKLPIRNVNGIFTMVEENFEFVTPKCFKSTLKM